VNRAVVLLSGGLDSTTLLHVVARGGAAVTAVSFGYGQKHARELDMAAWQAAAAGVRDHRIVDMAFYGRLIAGGSVLTDSGGDVPDLADLAPETLCQPPTYVPHRNLVLLSLAAGLAESIGADRVFYGAQAQDEYGYWDCTLDFVARLNDVLGLNRGTPVTIEAPFAEKRKAEVLRIGLTLGVDYAHTWTCYRGGERPCASCPSCMERATAFRDAGVSDPLEKAG